MIYGAKEIRLHALTERQTSFDKHVLGLAGLHMRRLKCDQNHRILFNSPACVWWVFSLSGDSSTCKLEHWEQQSQEDSGIVYAATDQKLNHCSQSHRTFPSGTPPLGPICYPHVFMLGNPRALMVLRQYSITEETVRASLDQVQFLSSEEKERKQNKKTKRCRIHASGINQKHCFRNNFLSF